MRKVLLRWKFSSLAGIDEIETLMEICERIEVLGHLSTESDGVTQLVELKINEGHSLSEISELESFEVLEKHEEDESGILWAFQFDTHIPGLRKNGNATGHH